MVCISVWIARMGSAGSSMEDTWAARIHSDSRAGFALPEPAEVAFLPHLHRAWKMTTKKGIITWPSSRISSASR